MNNKPSKFGIGVVIGAVTGALAALFLSPKTGKENRELVVKKIDELKKYLEEHEVEEKIKDIFDTSITEGKKYYTMAVTELTSRLDELGDKLAEIDKEAYMEKVNQTVDKLKNEPFFAKTNVKKLHESLMKGFTKLKEELQS